MREMKFSFCIIDDEPSKGRRKGWARAFELFSKKSYIKNIDSKEALSDNIDCAMGYKILSPETGFKLTGVKNYLIENQSTHDFFLIDLNLEHEDFVDDYKGFTKKNEYKDISEGDIPLFMAGLSFLNVLPKDKRPKIFFSGHEKALEISFYINILKNRLNDTYLENIDDLDYQMKIYDKIDNYLYKCQVQITSFLPFSIRDRLKRCLQEDNIDSWHSFDIIDRRNEDDFNSENRSWSLRTLFPRQYNLVSKGREPLKSEAIKYIGNILEVDWRKLLSGKFFQGSGLLCHPDSLPPVERERAKQMAEDLEFKPKGKSGNKYRPLTKYQGFAGDCASLRDGIIKGEADEYLIEYNYGSLNPGKITVGDYFSSIDTSERENWYNILYKWAANTGIYPTDIAYISHIAFLNKRHARNQEAPEFEYQEHRNNSVILTWTYSLPEEELSVIFNKISKLYAKFEGAVRDKYDLGDEGFSDIVKIILWRYYGVVEFRAGKYLLKVTRGKNGEIAINLDDNSPAIDSTVLRIEILAPV